MVAESYGPVPSIDTNWSLTFGSTLVIPGSLFRALEMSLAQPSQVMGTAKSVCFRFHQLRVSHLLLVRAKDRKSRHQRGMKQRRGFSQAKVKGYANHIWTNSGR